MKIGFISCCKTKRTGTAPASEIYCSPLFNYSYQYALQTCDRVYILSAKYGLLKPTDSITNYEQTLNGATDKVKRIWALATFRQIKNEVTEFDEIVWFAGENYRQYLKRMFANKQTVPLKGMAFGQQLAWYKSHIKP